jgi:hypothetical protein
MNLVFPARRRWIKGNYASLLEAHMSGNVAKAFLKTKGVLTELRHDPFTIRL